jgi:23S rRNA (adenine2503-C2)-methyltransferase
LKEQDKNNLFGKTVSQIESVLSAYHLPSYTSKQIADWIYRKGIFDFYDMTNLNKPVRQLLNEQFYIQTLEPVRQTLSTDGTKKYLFKTGTNNYIETAYIPEKKRSTLCVSSQAGCRMGCTFCMTSKQGFQANLNAGHIISQLHSLPEKESISNIVFMGMGEPLDNIDEVLNSIEIITGFYNISYKKITVSTIGLLPQIQRYIDECKCPLAISLHTPFHDERKKLMPVENASPLEKIIKYIKDLRLDKQHRISFEYILFEGLNDTSAHIKELSRLLGGLKCRINLIKYHSLPNSALKSPGMDKMIWFRNQLTQKGLFSTIRASRGEDIQAACGLLSTLQQMALSK